MASHSIQPALFLALPREIRDEIYRYAVIRSSPFSLYGHHASYLPTPLTTSPQIQSEALETFYATNTFTLDLDTPASATGGYTAQWHPPSGRFSHARPHIRHLMVDCGERYSAYTGKAYEEFKSQSDDRQRWVQLLTLPRLETLTIRMQKMHQVSLFTLDFGPIVYKLRALHPRIRISFHISFDTRLRAAWDDPMWQAAEPPVTAPHYQEMGYIDVTSLIVPPGEEDRAYVNEYVPSGKMPGLPLTDLGLLGETVANRRVLGTHYTVKEPALLRIQMQEQYEAFLEAERARDAEGKPKGILQACVRDGLD
ncbi:unnamed protein product [Periconia digitata]|uniref:Uncharacterized protein n=1 Tax=Periconia digitata TaxID=1303443 RepID=A0A9W4UXA0_9PLEO|nr:unnamed protein product [Periconia digitata]